MHKCDSCGKVIVNEQDYMCPHCGAVANKHCDHKSHLPDDRFSRTGAYNTQLDNNVNTTNATDTTQHKSKTYNYERIPKTNESQKFDINDLANIKNAEDAKRVAKKAFIEQDANGRKKFKPLAIVLIVIFAINIFSNLMSAAFDAVDGVFEGIESAFEDINSDYILGEELVTHHFSLRTYIDGATFDRENDCLTINVSEIFCEYYGSVDKEYDIVAEEWNGQFTSLTECINNGNITVSVAIYPENEVTKAGFDDDIYEKSVNLSADFTETGELQIYGLKSQLRNIVDEAAYCFLYTFNLKCENPDTLEEFACEFYLPFNYIKISSNNTVEFYDIYEDYGEEGKLDIKKIDLFDRYIPDDEEYEEYISF